MLYIIPIHILVSNTKLFPELSIMNISIKEQFGEGTSGLVYLLNDGNVVKIYKKSIAGYTSFEESKSILPKKNENREIPIFLKLIKLKKKKNIIKPYAICLIKKDIVLFKKKIRKNTYLSIMPKYNQINKKILYNYNLFDLIKTLINCEISIEKYLNVYHLDIKSRKFSNE